MRRELMLLLALLVILAGVIAACSPEGAVEDAAVEDVAGDSEGEAADVAEEVDPDRVWSITNMTTAELGEFYEEVLPFTDVLPLPPGPVGDGSPIVIGFSQTGFNHPWRVEMIKSAQAEVARHPNVTLIVTDGNVDIAKQNNDVQDLLAQGVDAVVMSPVESAGLVPAGNRVIDAGLPLILLDRDIPSFKTLFIGQSNITMAEAVAKVMAERLGGEGNVLEITGLIGSSPAIDRQRGMMNVVEEESGIQILATGDGEWIRDPAVALMEDWLVAYDDINAVFSHAEESSWGAQFAIARANRCDENIMHFTHDGSNAGFQSVKDGLFEADGNYTPFIGDIGVRAALYTLLDMEIPDKQEYEFEGWLLRLPDLPVVTQENVDEWLGRGWGDFAPPDDPCACGHGCKSAPALIICSHYHYPPGEYPRVPPGGFKRSRYRGTCNEKGKRIFISYPPSLRG